MGFKPLLGIWRYRVFFFFKYLFGFMRLKLFWPSGNARKFNTTKENNPSEKYSPPCIFLYGALCVWNRLKRYCFVCFAFIDRWNVFTVFYNIGSTRTRRFSTKNRLAEFRPQLAIIKINRHDIIENNRDPSSSYFRVDVGLRPGRRRTVTVGRARFSRDTNSEGREKKKGWKLLRNSPVYYPFNERV